MLLDWGTSMKEREPGRVRDGGAFGLPVFFIPFSKWSRWWTECLYFPLPLQLAKREKLALASLYLGPLYARPDECIGECDQLSGQISRDDSRRIKLPVNVHLGVNFRRWSRNQLSKWWRWSALMGRGGWNLRCLQTSGIVVAKCRTSR